MFPQKTCRGQVVHTYKKKDGLLSIGDILSRVAVRRLLIDDTCIESITLISVANKTRQKTQRAINYFTLNIFTSLASWHQVAAKTAASPTRNILHRLVIGIDERQFQWPPPVHRLACPRSLSKVPLSLSYKVNAIESYDHQCPGMHGQVAVVQEPYCTLLRHLLIPMSLFLMPLIPEVSYESNGCMWFPIEALNVLTGLDLFVGMYAFEWKIRSRRTNAMWRWIRLIADGDVYIYTGAAS